MNRKPELRTWVDELFEFLARIAGAINRKNARFLREATALMSPYAVRSLSRRKLRGLMLAASIALALVTFLLFSAYTNATSTRLVGNVQPLKPGHDIDAIAVASYGAGRSFPEGAEANPSLLSRGKAQEAVLGRVYTSFGSTRCWGFAAEGLSRESIELSRGAFPTQKGDVAVPADWAKELGAEVGEQLKLSYLDPDTQQWRTAAGRIVAVMKSNSYISQYPVTTLGTLKELRRTEAPNALLVRWSSRTPPASGVKRLESLYSPEQIITPQTPQKRARELVGGVFSPVRIVVLIVFAFSALGVLNVMLLSFLQRKRQFGILKAAGAENRELQVLLLLEGFLMALAGIAAGLILSTVAVFLLNRYTADRYVLDAGAVALGVVFSAVVFYLGAWLPITMLRNATVDELLKNRRLA